MRRRRRLPGCVGAVDIGDVRLRISVKFRPMTDPTLPTEVRRESWLDAFSRYRSAPGVAQRDARQRLAHLDALLYDCWRLGERVILIWSSTGSDIALLCFPHFALAEYVSGVRRIEGESAPDAYIDSLVTRGKHVDCTRFQEISRKLGIDPIVLPLPFDPIRELGAELVDALIRRYSVSLFHDRAVVLLDIVGFSTHEPIEQATLLNSLSYSINAAYDKLAGKDGRIQFARSPTGDGFYIWNRSADQQGNVQLYKLMLLLLADNALARAKARTRAVPELRSGFHVGEHYEFFQSEGLSPSLTSYLVGQVTIDLARMLDQAMAGQIVIGDFPQPGTDAGGDVESAAEFVARMQREVTDLAGIRLAGEHVRDIRCYLTGPLGPDGSYGISRYGGMDKHGMLRWMFNAKINIHRHDASPIYLGIRDAEVRGFKVEKYR